MAKSFNNLDSKLLHPLGFINHGKYKDCRLDTVIDMDPGYCLWMHNNGYWTLSKSALEQCKNYIRVTDATINAEDDASYFDEDIPF